MSMFESVASTGRQDMSTSESVELSPTLEDVAATNNFGSSVDKKSIVYASHIPPRPLAGC